MLNEITQDKWVSRSVQAGKMQPYALTDRRYRYLLTALYQDHSFTPLTRRKFSLVLWLVQQM
jgi:hypothetical protein